MNFTLMRAPRASMKALPTSTTWIGTVFWCCLICWYAESWFADELINQIHAKNIPQPKVGFACCYIFNSLVSPMHIQYYHCNDSSEYDLYLQYLPLGRKTFVQSKKGFTCWYSLVSPMMLRIKAAIAPGLSGSTTVEAVFQSVTQSRLTQFQKGEISWYLDERCQDKTKARKNTFGFALKRCPGNLWKLIFFWAATPCWKIAWVTFL